MEVVYAYTWSAALVDVRVALVTAAPTDALAGAQAAALAAAALATARATARRRGSCLGLRTWAVWLHGWRAVECCSAFAF
jgi:hypothetical protein